MINTRICLSAGTVDDGAVAGAPAGVSEARGGTAWDPRTGAKRFIPFSDGVKSCMGQALGLMEVRRAIPRLESPTTP